MILTVRCVYGDGFPVGYNIDGDLNGENIALIDSLGSQANRIDLEFSLPTAPVQPTGRAPSGRDHRQC